MVKVENVVNAAYTMKFTKGKWLNGKGVEAFSAVQVRETRVEGDRLYTPDAASASDTASADDKALEFCLGQ